MKHEIIITILLIAGLFILLSILGALLVFSFVIDIEHECKGVVACMSFILAAVIFGAALNKVINRIKRLWE